jgi:hypothetical protein
MGRVSQDQMPTVDALRVAASAVTARDFYAGQVPSHVKELLDDSCRRTPWRNDKGDLIRYPVGTIHRVVLTWAAELHARRRRLIYGDTLETGLQPKGSLAERAGPGQGSQEPEPEAEEDYSDQQTQSQHWTQGVSPRSAQSQRYAQTHDVNAFQRALWKSRRGRPRPAPQDRVRGQVPPRQPCLERIEDPDERQLRPAPPGPVPQQRQPALLQRSDSSSMDAVNAALGTVTGTTPSDGDCALNAAAGIGHAQLGPEELAAANAAAGALRAALLQHAKEQSDGYRQQAGTLGWGPAEWARHAAAATYTATGEPGAAGHQHWGWSTVLSTCRQN